MNIAYTASRAFHASHSVRAPQFQSNQKDYSQTKPFNVFIIDRVAKDYWLKDSLNNFQSEYKLPLSDRSPFGYQSEEDAFSDIQASLQQGANLKDILVIIDMGPHREGLKTANELIQETALEKENIILTSIFDDDEPNVQEQGFPFIAKMTLNREPSQLVERRNKLLESV